MPLKTSQARTRRAVVFSRAALSIQVSLAIGMILGGGQAFSQVSASTVSLPVAMTTEQGLALARAKACLGCHQVDSKRVGPAFTVIAARRAQQEDAVSYLTHVIRKGGRGQYGAVPMPGQPVNEQDAQKLAQWILTLRK